MLSSYDYLSQTNWDLQEAISLIAKDIKDCRGWTKREPTPDQHLNRYDDELTVLRITVEFEQWFRRFVDIVYSGMYNPYTCGLCRTCLLPSRLTRMLMKSLQRYNRMYNEDYFDNDCIELNDLRQFVVTDFQKRDNSKKTIIENVVRKVVHNEYGQRCCQHKSKDATSDTLQDIESALTKVVGDHIDHILDLIVTLTAANTYYSPPGTLYDPLASNLKYDYLEIFAPEEAGLVISCQLFDILDDMTGSATKELTNKRKERLEKRQLSSCDMFFL
jgi:hypothetical protein